MSKHTPGPWSLSTEGNPPPLLTRITGSSQLICVTDSANARLIAATPELLGLAREVAEVAETVAALLCSPGEAKRWELVSVITGIGARAAALVNDAVKEEA